MPALRLRWGLLISILGVTVIDRLTKLLAVHTAVARPLLPGWLELDLFFNRNIVFWFEIPFVLTTGIALIAVSLIGLVLLRALQTGQHSVAWAAGLIIAGAASNWWDRLRFGAVIDFIRVPFWSVFNLADVSIVVGALVLVFLARSQARNT